MDNTDLFSRKIPAGRRIFFLDIKQSPNGAYYIKLAEKKRNEDGGEERHQLMVFEEDVERFYEAFTEVVVQLREMNKDRAKQYLTD